MHPEAFYEPGQEVTTVQPHTIVFLLAEYENAMASVAFERIPELIERLRIIAREEGFDLDRLPVGDDAKDLAEHLPRINGKVWYVALDRLQDLATVTMIGDRPVIRPDIFLKEGALLSRTQVRRYEHLQELAEERHIPMDKRYRDQFSVSPDQQVYADVVYNLSAIAALDEKKYPTLAYYKRQRVFLHLKGLMLNILSHPYPVWPEGQPRYFTIGKEYLAAWCKDQGIPGSSMSWQGSLIFLRDCGLVKSFRPIGDSHDPAITSVIAGIRKPGKKNITFRTVPRYTPDALERAECIAALYARSHIKLTHLTKTDVIRLRGRGRADELYLDGRCISESEAYVHDLYLAVMNWYMGQYGYAEPAKILRDVRNRMSRDLHFQPLDFFAEHTQEEREELTWQYRYLDALLKMKERTRQLAAEAGAVYRPVKREDRSRLHLPDGYMKWIIVRTVNPDTTEPSS